MKQVQDDLQQRFGKELPAKQTLLKWERKLFQTGCEKNKPRSGRPQSRVTQCQGVDHAISKYRKNQQAMSGAWSTTHHI